MDKNFQHFLFLFIIIIIRFFSIHSVVDFVFLMSIINRAKTGLFGPTKPRNPHSLENLK